MRINIEFGNRKNNRNQFDDEFKHHQERMKNLQNQLMMTKQQIDNLMKEKEELRRRNMLSAPRQQQLDRQIDDLKGIVMRIMQDMDKERNNFRGNNPKHRRR